MNIEKQITCSNCKSTDFYPTELGWILATEGKFTVQAYACKNCGHVEIFDPDFSKKTMSKDGRKN